MLTPLLRTGLAASIALIWISACAPIVVVDADGDGGDGGGTVVSNSNNTNTTFVAVTTAVGVDSVSTTSGGIADPGGPDLGGINPKALCDSICSFRSVQCGEPDCLENCLSLVDSGVCSPQLERMLRCVQNNQIDCGPPVACQREVDELNRCQNGNGSGCEDLECSGDEDSVCSCRGACGGRDLAVECIDHRDGADCRCFEGGHFIGSCQEPEPTCSPVQGCCRRVFGMNRP